MAGYTRQSLADIQDGEDIVAGPLNDEFDALQSAFNGTTGHAHDGSTGNGPKIVLTGAAAVTGVLPVANGGTGGATAADARTNLGLAIGTNVQAYDAGLQSISGLTTAADTMIYTTALDVYATTALTPFARTVLDDTTAGAVLTTLGVSAFVQTIFDDAAATNVLTTLGVSTYAKTLLDDADAATSRTTLGLGTSATVNTGTSGATIPLLNGNNTHSGTNVFTDVVRTDAAFIVDPVLGIQFNTSSTPSNYDGIDYDDSLGEFTFYNDGDSATTFLRAGAIRLEGTNDVTLTSENHAFQIGSSTSTNMAIDGNEIMARNNSAATTLVLNADGGNITLGHSSATVTINGTLAGLAVGSSVQAWDADLDFLANNSVASAGNFLVYRRNDAGTLSTATASTTGFQVLAGNASSIRTSIELASSDDVTFNSVTNSGAIGVADNTSGYFLGDGGTSFINRSGAICTSLNRFTSTGTISQFRNDGTVVGSISVTGSATAYNTSSDVRLKQDFQLINPALLDLVKVYDFEWVNGDGRAFGVKAQELEEVLPQAVHKGDDPENDMWSVDYSKLVPLLIAKVQDLEARLKVLEN
jgi:hypothetical protein